MIKDLSKKLVGKKIVAAFEISQRIGSDSSTDTLILDFEDGSSVKLSPVSAIGGEFACTFTDGDPNDYVG